MTKPLRLLLLEDDPDDAELVVAALKRAGYACDWRRVQTREDFLSCLEHPDFDLVLADYNLPSFDGLSALQILKDLGADIPFILVSGTVGEERAIESLKAGATDYVMKERLERLGPVVSRALADKIELARRRLAQRALHEAHSRLKAMSVRLMQAEEAERRRIARELHDECGQLLTAIKLRLASLDPKAAEFQRRRGECVEAVDQALEQMRRLSRDLRPSQLDDLGLIAALRSHLDTQARNGGLTPHFAHQGIPERLPPEIESTCFRIAQEAMTNIVRHANAREVWVTLTADEGELNLEVRDDGQGFDVAAARRAVSDGKSMGLLSMEERVELAGGRIVFESAPGMQTRVGVVLPLRGLAAPEAGA